MPVASYAPGGMRYCCNPSVVADGLIRDSPIRSSQFGSYDSEKTSVRSVLEGGTRNVYSVEEIFLQLIFSVGASRKNTCSYDTVVLYTAIFPNTDSFVKSRSALRAWI